MEYVLLFVAVVAVVAFVVSGPLRKRSAPEGREDDRIAELEAAKEAKYREIHDAELDYRMGKLSEDDWKALDRELRAQAIEILKRLDELGA